MAAKKTRASKTRRRNTSDGFPTDAATRYAIEVVEGREVAGPHVRAACDRHLYDLRTAAKRGMVWDLDTVERVLGYFPDVLRLNGGQFEGKRFDLHPSQAFIVASIFGWKWAATGARRYRRAYIEIGKGNGKSPLAGGIGLYCLTADGEPRAEVYAAATKKDQAMILFRDAVAMVKQSSALSSRLMFSGGADKEWNIAHIASGSFFRAMSNDDGQSGPRPHAALCDEVHEHRTGQTIEMLERGFKSRRQPILLMITNSGSDRKSACWEEHCHAIKVAAREIEDDTTFSYVCALDEGDEPLDPIKGPLCWKKANPLLGTILTEDYLADVARQGRDMLGKRNLILRLHFCVWTDADSAWMKRDAWEAIEDPDLRLEDMTGRKVWAGLDLGATKDMSGLAYLFEDGETDDGKPKFALCARGYMPAEGLAERAKEDQAPYPVWVEQGWLIATPGAVARLDYIARDLVEVSQDNDLQALAFDVWLFRKFQEELDAIGVGFPVQEHPQGFHRRRDSALFMPDSINAFETLILDGRLRVEVNPALRSAVMSAVFNTSPAGLRRFEKSKATARIDLCVGATQAVGAATASAEAVRVIELEPGGLLL